jgi:hypothetical protein
MNRAIPRLIAPPTVGKGVNSRLFTARFSFSIDLNGLNGWNDLKKGARQRKMAGREVFVTNVGCQVWATSKLSGVGIQEPFLLMPTAYWEPAVFRRETFPKLKQ